MTCEPLINPSRRRCCNKTFCSLLDGLDHWPSTGRWIRCFIGHGRPRPFEGGDFMPNNKNSEHGRNWRPTAWKPLQTIWITWQNAIWPRTTICSKGFPSNDEETRNKISIVNSLSSSNRWNNRKGKPRDWSVPGNILSLSSRIMEGKDPHSRIHS